MKKKHLNYAQQNFQNRLLAGSPPHARNYLVFQRQLDGDASRLSRTKYL